VFLTGLVARRELRVAAHQSPSSVPPARRLIDGWTDAQADGQVIGAVNGRVTLVEFSDFQCPYCGYFYNTLVSLIAEFPDDLRVVYRHYPLQSIHPQARAAAVASECAARQSAFEPYYHALFKGQGMLPLSPWIALAHTVGLDTVTFGDCLRSPLTAGRLASDSVMVVRLGLHGTPTVIVDGWELPGTPTREAVRAVIMEALVRDGPVAH
jgi:protein-disulfide isomerase